MKFNKKLFGLLMFVMLICCVSAASAADVDDIVGAEDADILEVDDAVDSVDVVGQDDSDDVADELEQEEVGDVTDEVKQEDISNVTDELENTRGAQQYVTNGTVGAYFDTSTGYIKSSAPTGLIFQGSFDHMPFSNFIINKGVSLSFSNAVFNDVGFELLSPGLAINGATFIMNAPNGANCTLISVGADDVIISNNVINYTCNYANTAKYNHVIRVVNSEDVEVSGNNITAYLPLKDVDYSQPYPSIYTDLVAGVAVQYSNSFRFTNNRLLVNVSRNSTGYPTLDAFIIVGSQEAYIAHNTIIEIDNKTMPGNNNYLYAVDVYQCSNSVIDMNKITLESKGGSFIAGTNNGTGAAYGIQLTGGHTGIVISNNNITTSNNGPNCGIYSQNYPGYTSLSITGNRINVSGNAGLHAWSLVTGMELGDDDDYVARNIVNVINKAPYVSTHNAYGISYSQSAMRHPYFNITNNTVEVKNGTYAVFIMSGGSGSVTNNCLNTTAHCCNNAVNSNPNVIVSGNYCPNPNCTCGCNCTSHNNIPTKSILKSREILGVSAPEVLSSVNDELLTETECIIYVGENKTENGNGSYENPFATLELAHASVSGHYDKIIINIFNGTYQLNKEFEFDTAELIVQGVTGEVILIAPSPFGDFTKAAFKLSSSNSKFAMNNITFDGGTESSSSNLAYFVPISGQADIVTFTNCKFTSIKYLLSPSYNSYYINCVFENLRCKHLYFDDFDGTHFANFKNTIFLAPSNFKTISDSKYDVNANICLDGIWFGQNSVPIYVTSNPGEVILTKYAMFSASETYIGNNQYEIIGKLTWNGTENQDGMDNFQPMTVTLSSDTGDIQASAVLVNGTFKAIYNSTSSSNLVNVVLDSVEIPLSFNSIDLVVDAPSIICSDNQNITVTFPQIVSGNITVLVDGTPTYVGAINNDSIIIPVTAVLSAGTHNVNVTFSDEVNHIYGFNTTSFTVSKVSNYDFNATVNPTSLYVGDNATVSIVTLPSGAAGNITVRVRGKDAVVFDVNDVIVIGGFVAGENNVNITFSGDNYDAKSIEIIVFASTRPTTLSAPDVTTDYNVTKDLVITLTSNNEVLANKTVNVVVGSINENLTTDAGGKVSIDISNLDPNTYAATITFAGDELYNSSSTTSTVVVKENIKTNITIPEITAGKSTTTTIKLPEKATGNITVTIDGKVSSVVNLTNGTATITIPELSAGKHDVVISYSGDGNYASFSQNSTVTVKESAKPTPAPAPVKKAKQATKIIAKNKKFKAKTKVKKYTITLKAGKKTVKNVQVTIKIGKKTYKAKTNAKGKATFKIKKLTKKAKYKATIKFKGNKNYKATTKKVKITIK